MQHFTTPGDGQMVSYHTINANTQVIIEADPSSAGTFEEQQLTEVGTQEEKFLQDGTEQVIHVATNAEGDVTSHLITIEPQPDGGTLESESGHSVLQADHYNVVIEEGSMGETYTVQEEGADGEPSLVQEICLQEAVVEDQPAEEIRMHEVDLDSIMEVVTEFRCKFCTASYMSVKDLKEHIQLVHMNILETLVTQQSRQKHSVDNSQTVAETEQMNMIVEDKQSDTVLQSLLSGEISMQHSVACSTDVEQTSEGALHISESLPNENTAGVSHMSSYHRVHDDTKFSVDKSVELGDQVQQSGSAGDAETSDKEVFLCGQCGQGFASINECKSHMIANHNISDGASGEGSVDGVVYPPNKISVATQVQVPERNKPGRKKKVVPPDDGTAPVEKPDEDCVENEPEEIEVFETMGKRKVRPPRRLADLYVLSKRKHIGPSRAGNEPYKLKCDTAGCLARFKTEAALDIHSRCHVVNRIKGESPFLCTECEKPFSQWRVIRSHLWQEHGLDTDLFACDQCEFRSVSVYQMDSHREVHNTNLQFPCKVCGKAFKQRRQLRNHQTLHAAQAKDEDRAGGLDENDVGNWYDDRQCDICKRKFANQKCLRKHKEEVHGSQKPYLCPYCGHSASRKAMMELHVRIHTGDKPFKCDLCDYRTGDHNSLRRHRMRHTGQKAYKCAHCAYSCIQAISLKSHMKLKHPGQEGYYACTQCNYRTVNKLNWENHQEDHRNGLVSSVPALNIASNAGSAPANTDSSQDGPLQISSSDMEVQGQNIAGSNTGVIDSAQIMQISSNADFHTEGSIQYQISPSLGYMRTVSGFTNQAQPVINTIAQSGIIDSSGQTVTVHFDPGTTNSDVNATTIGQIQDGSYDASTGSMVYTIRAPASSLNNDGQLGDGDIMVYTIAGQDLSQYQQVSELSGQFIGGGVSGIQLVQETNDHSTHSIPAGSLIQGMTNQTNGIINSGQTVQLVQELDTGPHQLITSGQQLQLVEQTVDQSIQMVSSEAESHSHSQSVSIVSSGTDVQAARHSIPIVTCETDVAAGDQCVQPTSSSADVHVSGHPVQIVSSADEPHPIQVINSGTSIPVPDQTIHIVSPSAVIGGHLEGQSANLVGSRPLEDGQPVAMDTSENHINIADDKEKEAQVSMLVVD